MAKVTEMFVPDQFSYEPEVGEAATIEELESIPFVAALKLRSDFGLQPIGGVHARDWAG